MDLGEEVQRVDESDTGDDELLSSPSSRISHGLLHEQMGTSQSMGHVQVPSSLGMHSSGTSEPEASMAMDGSIHQLHQLNQTDFQELPVLSLSQSRSIAQSLANRLLNVTTPMMTQTNILSLKRPPPLDSSEIPRKKSRNYLDSHKSIEKRRRDRINNCLTILKTMVPDCRQYGSKKLDKAEILEMSIEYIQRMQQQAFGKTGGAVTGFDLAMAQREWASELTAWVIQNKLLFSGPTALDQFTNSLLLHLQGYSSSHHLQQPGSLPSAALLQSVATGSSSTEESPVDPMYRQILLQQLQTSVSGQVASAVRHPVGSKPLPPSSSGAASSSSVVAASISQATGSDPGQHAITASNQVQQHLQAILLLQQQQNHLLQQQQEEQGEAPSDPQTQQQIQQLQNLQLLIAQHLTSEGMSQKLNLQQLATLLHLLQQHQMQKEEEREAPEQSDIMPQTPPTVNQTVPSDLGHHLGMPSDLREVTAVPEVGKRAPVLMSLQEGYLTGGASQDLEQRGEWSHMSENAAPARSREGEDSSQEVMRLGPHTPSTP